MVRKRGGERIKKLFLPQSNNYMIYSVCRLLNGLLYNCYQVSLTSVIQNNLGNYFFRNLKRCFTLKLKLKKKIMIVYSKTIYFYLSISSMFPITFLARKSLISSGFVVSIPKYSGKSFVVVSISVVLYFFA